jgi:carboxyl-terminal processing protease
MSYTKTKTFIMAAPVVLLGIFFIASCATCQKVSLAAKADPPAPVRAGRLTPGPNDARIAYVTAELMEHSGFTQQTLDQEMSKKFFDGYLDALDARHEYFLQSDLAEFDHYRTNLDRLTIGAGAAKLDPAFEIFQRFLERLQQHNDYVMALLAEDHFKFNTDERIAIDRRHEPYPKDLAEAEALWAQQLKYDYLMDKLSQEIIVTNGNLLVKLPKTAATNITDTLTRRYQRYLHIYTNWDSTDVLQTYLNGLTHAFDPHSDYFNPEHAQDFAINMNLSLFGIGAQLTEDLDGYCKISKLIEGGPADKSKQLAAEDRVVMVGQGTNAPVNVVGMELGKVVQLIRGPKGTEVQLTVTPADDPSARKVVALVRDEIKLDDSEHQASAKLIELPDGQGGVTRLGVIDLPSFYAPVGDLLAISSGSATPKYTSVDVARLVKKLKQEKVKGIVLDLRTNPGGSLEEAVRLTGLFIKDGPVVLAKSPDNDIQVDKVPEPGMLYGGPLAVMINRYSASASEIAAAALQDYDRALIVGDSKSFGKGTVQQLEKLRPWVWPATASATNDPGVVKLTIRKFYRISGASTESNGVMSDIVLPDPLDYQTHIESESTLENSLPSDTVSNSVYTKFNLVQPYLAALKEKSAARTAASQDFAYLREDIEQIKKQDAERGITLNEDEAIKERRANQARQRAREVERAARPLAGLKIYNLSLTNLDNPGLPAPSYYPGIWETNFTSSVRNLAVLKLDAATNYADADKAFAKDIGLDLATGKFRNGLNTLTNTLTDAAAAAAAPPTPDKNLVKEIIKIYTYTNAAVTINTGTVKVKNLPDLDPILQETDNIMLDYISLLSAKDDLTKK